MNERVYNSGIERLRSPERVERLEVERVVDLCLAKESIKSVLDVGTGSGLFAEAFHKQNLAVSGIDINPEMVEASKKILPDCEFRISGAEEIPFHDNSFDIVFFGVVFHEVTDFRKVLEEAKRIANKSVCILEWNYKSEDFGPPLEHRIKSEFIENLSNELKYSSFQRIPLSKLVLYILEK